MNATTILGNPEAAKMELPVVKQWFADRGDHTLRVDYPLNEDSIVLDVGGYEGNWSQQMYDRYRCTIHVFEPVPAFAEQIRSRFHHDARVHVHVFGLSDHDGTATIYIDNDATSVHKGKGVPTTIELRRANDVLMQLGLGNFPIDLIKINIEGCEYELLQHLMDTKSIHFFRDIQVQFHDFVVDAPRRMAALQQSLSMTHDLSWQYRFVWENWHRSGAGL